MRQVQNFSIMNSYRKGPRKKLKLKGWKGLDESSDEEERPGQFAAEIER